MKRAINVKGIFYKRLKESRGRRALTQEQLGKEAGINSSMIAHFESGSRLPSLENLYRIAEALLVSVDYLIGLTEEYIKWDVDIMNGLSILSAKEYDLIKHMIEYMGSKR